MGNHDVPCEHCGEDKRAGLCDGRRCLQHDLAYEKTLRFNREADRPEALNTDDYRIAPGNRGPQARTWKDKPHRLIYDLCEEVERVRAVNAALQTELAVARTSLEDMKIQRDELKLRNALLQAGRLSQP